LRSIREVEESQCKGACRLFELIINIAF
jgi:hypothetical protein